MKKLVCMLLLMAGLPALAQEPAGKFSYSGKDVPLQKLLDSIKNAAGMKLAIAAGYWMRNTRPVTIRMKKEWYYQGSAGNLLQRPTTEICF